MKKLMIAAAVALAGVAVNAASFNWESSGTLANQDGETLDSLGIIGVGGYYVYAMIDNGTPASAGAFTAFSHEDALAAINGGSVAFLADHVTAGGAQAPEMGMVSGASTDVLAENSAFSAYLVITDADADHLADATYAWISSTIDGTIDGYGNVSPSPLSFDTSSTDGGWTKLASSPEPVPEPTSGLLLLLGVAGLALRRRRA